jgi:hypothetical protein
MQNLKWLMTLIAPFVLSGCVLLDALSPCPGPRAADALEPNDTRQTATPLTQLRESSLNPGETDVFQFEASAEGKLQLITRILEGNGNDNPGLNLLVEGPNSFKLEKKSGSADNTIELVAAGAGTHFLTVTDGSRKYADCLVCTCTGRGPKYSLELKVVP